MNIRELAERAGVSTSTVSRVLNNSGYVSATLRARVQAIIAETGYVPSGIAKNLKANRSDAIGIIIPRINSYASGQIVAGMAQALAARGLFPLLGNAANDPDEELRYLDIFRSHRVSGVLMLATRLTDRHLTTMRQMGVPVVVTGQDASAQGFTSVIQDERRALRQITDYLIRSGHRRIGLIGGPDWDIQIGQERRAGYLDALAAAGITPDPALMVSGGFDLADGAAGIDRLVPYIDRGTPTAVLAVTDRLAIGAISRLHQRRLAVPGEISVAGVGDIDSAAAYNPPLTTVHYDYHATGQRAAELLLAQIGGAKAPLRHVMPFDLRIRDSVTPPAPSAKVSAAG
ncbi:MAG: LacI family DNA-binding transcriptional regulator [Paracoccus sp. (in: a-proteobacteria)]|uniref:LacI family DNA-binding transcriptional regulator n=1 Tax=Paracoccus sp. TaxID=267 RepID=UPI0026E10476|nr:LacI family DNA-binding transcriptional regulator [Paracoccus sp. (in: a-proteobacteria)]MDO5620280.1 LacI family DNA-binding transcriptional regulator [Paracoccus sp. (in: a-proteobacteria)]